MARASGRLRLNADTTSRPLPSPSRKSTTANAGAALPICAKPSDTLSQEVTEKPRLSIARESRSRNGLSSSTIRSERSAWPVSSEMAFTLRYPCARLQTYGVTARRCQDRTKSIGSILKLQPASRCAFRQHFAHFEALPRPRDLDHRAMVGKDPVGEGDFGAGSLQQGTRDKHPQPQSAVVSFGFLGATPPRQIGFADSLDDVGGKARPIVGNDDLDGVVIPPRIHLDGAAREID